MIQIRVWLRQGVRRVDVLVVAAADPAALEPST